MVDVGLYDKKTQTYIKHFFFERYLKRVVYNIYSFADEFVYVDGFSGPWRSIDEKYEDTSFAIAIRELSIARNVSAKRGSLKQLECIFVEENRKSFNELQAYLASVPPDIVCTPYHSQFEDAVPNIVRTIGRKFAFCFIDPTGFSGFGMKAMSPLLKLRGEVLINFMFNHVNRFIDHPEAALLAQMDELFGGAGWREEVDREISNGSPRESAILQVYCNRLKMVGTFKYVTSTRVMFEDADRTYFYLIYGTNHPKGLLEFRAIEKKTVEEQENVRDRLRFEKRSAETAMNDLFAPELAPLEKGYNSYDDLREDGLRKAENTIRTLLRRGNKKYEELWSIFELPYVCESDLKDILNALEAAGAIRNLNKGPRQRRPKKGDVFTLV